MLTSLYFRRADFGFPRDLLRIVPWDKTGGKREEDRARVYSVMPGDRTRGKWAQTETQQVVSEHETLDEDD